jgi:hypothetical protein
VGEDERKEGSDDHYEQRRSHGHPEDDPPLPFDLGSIRIFRRRPASPSWHAVIVAPPGGANSTATLARPSADTFRTRRLRDGIVFGR